jgi:CheY-like chemotaxis protein
MAAKQIVEDELRIAVLDDRKEPRETVMLGLRPKLPKGWTIVACPLLKDRQNYAAWLINNRVAVLLLDQMLNEQAPDSELPVTYKGNDVIRAIRQQLPDFPIVVVTKAKEDTDLVNHFGEADDIVDRKDLLKSDQYAIRIVRLGRAYVSQFEDELARLAELSKYKAMGKETGSDAKELKAIQTKLGLPSMLAGEGDVAINSLETEVEKLEALCKKVEAFLKQRQGPRKTGRQASKKRKS